MYNVGFLSLLSIMFGIDQVDNVDSILSKQKIIIHILN